MMWMITGHVLLRLCGTRNGRTIIKKIEKDTGIRIEIIDGQEEARMIYNNHIECMEDRLGNYMYVDVGGGSTEINLLTNGELVWSVSYNIGTVRMLSNAVKEGTWQQMEEELMKVTEGVAAINIIGSVGILISCSAWQIRRIRSCNVCRSVRCKQSMMC